jgi:hypothetical protein
MEWFVLFLELGEETLIFSRAWGTSRHFHTRIIASLAACSQS